MTQIHVQIGYLVLRIAQIVGLAGACYLAYQARLHAVNNFGRVIHEFDPYFNFRATEYLVDNGWKKFINWYDERSWYPLGRPVGMLSTLKYKTNTIRINFYQLKNI